MQLKKIHKTLFCDMYKICYKSNVVVRAIVTQSENQFIFDILRLVNFLTRDRPKATPMILDGSPSRSNV